MSPGENTSQHTTRPDPIKLAFADRLADAALSWYHIASMGANANFDVWRQRTADLFAIVHELQTALDARESGNHE